MFRLIVKQTDYRNFRSISYYFFHMLWTLRLKQLWISKFIPTNDFSVRLLCVLLVAYVCL